MTGQILKFVIGLILIFKLAKASSFYDFDVEDHEGNKISLSKYKGQITLVVNVASQCGFTDATYRALTRLHDILSYDGYFSVLAFPCNQFGEQEPGEISEIVTSMEAEYGVEFPIFNKINVIGSEASPAFKNLIEQSAIVPDWNFYKYLLDGKGHVIEAWGTRVTIEEIFDTIQSAIEAEKHNSSEDNNFNAVKDEDANSDVKDEL